MTVDTPPDTSFLSPEQADTNRLIDQLLGTAVAYRYIDFCRLASGTLPLIVSRPLAGHALRELDSLVRSVLVTPMEARASDNDDEVRRRSEARKKLKELGFEESVLQRAEKALKPTFSHAKQIAQIVTRLGLAPDGDIARLWIKLNQTYGRVHERSFHANLPVDETFKTEFVRPFETVIRALMVQLQGRYAALMHRVKEIAADPPSRGVRLFVNEIPGALPLQTFFYENLSSPAWLPHLASEGLLAEPLPNLEGGSSLRLWGWPVGRYLRRMASSENDATRMQVAQAIRGLASSQNTDVQRLGMEVIEALPAAEGASLIDILEGWITSTTDLFTAAPHSIVAKWAAAGLVAPAVRMARLVFQLSDRNGQLGGHFDVTMYEHHLNEAVKVLSNAKPLEALPGLCELLMESSRADKRLSQLDGADYSHYVVGSFVGDDAHGHDFLAAQVMAVVRVAAAAIRAHPEDLKAVLDHLAPYQARIFRRMRLHLVTISPSSAPDLAAAELTDVSLVDQEWCRKEYSALASAWFSHLSEPEQQRILAHVDSIAETHIGSFHSWFERQEGRKAGAEDERRYREEAVRDAVWQWREALPADRRAAVEKTAAEFGDPDAWRQRFLRWPESPLSQKAMLEQAPATTASFLQSWQPGDTEQSNTASALAGELREAVVVKPELFSGAAEAFATLRPLFIRHFFDGLIRAAGQGASLDWGPCLALVETVLEQSAKGTSPATTIPGDDPDWSWARKAMVEWLTASLAQGANGIAFTYYERVRALVLGLTSVLPVAPDPSEEEFPLRGDRPYFAARRTQIGAHVELALCYLFWSSKDEGNPIGKAPREALAHDAELRAVLETALARGGQAGRAARAIFGRHLNSLHFFGEAWLRERIPLLFPKEDQAARQAAWIAHLEDDRRPIADLTEALYDLYSEHIAVAGREDEALSSEGSRKRLVDYLVTLYLWDRLPENLLQEFWQRMPPALLREAMWFAGRHLGNDNAFRDRAETYWDRRLALAARATDKAPFKKELGLIGMWFSWGIDPDWLLAQLMRLLYAGFAPNDGVSLIAKLAERLPGKTDEIVEAVRLLVGHLDVQPWIFGAQEQALRNILIQGKASASPTTVASVKEIISFLSSRGNTAFLDLYDGLPGPQAPS
ncbi:hypothetical protein [Bradyrhizobium ottawaense]|uniref:hypothetical protein n=1 Tax=Bradyrhizobium ottawaense TaxID=931866 RepID=UPI003FA0AA42